MTLQIVIKNQIVETVEIELNHNNYPTFSQRAAVVDDYKKYLKRKYNADVMLTNDWKIEMIAASKMQYLKEEDYAIDASGRYGSRH